MKKQQNVNKTYTLKKLRTGKLVVALAGAFITGIAMSNNASAAVEGYDTLPTPDTEWVARTVDQVKQDVSDFSKPYQIKWGDTLSVIAEATGIDYNKIAADNGIKDVNLIFVGNWLYQKDGYVATTDKETGEVKVYQEQPSTPTANTREAVNAAVQNTTMVDVTNDNNDTVQEIRNTVQQALDNQQGTTTTTPVQPVVPTTNEQPTEPTQPIQPTVPVTPEVPTTEEKPTSQNGEVVTEEKLPEAVVNSRVEMAEIPFKEIVKEDADLEVGTVKVIQEGVNGYEKKRIDIITVDNIIVDTHIETLETKEAIDKIIVKGTKVVTPVVPVTPDPVQPTVPVTPTSEKGDANKEDELPQAVVSSKEVTEDVPFKEIVKEDADLEVGTEKVIQDGVNGYTKKRIDTITVDGKVVDQREVIVETKEAKDKVIVKGTKVVTPVVPVTPDPVEPVTPVVPEQPTSEKGDANKEEKLPEAVVNSKEVVEEINFNEVTREDDQLEEGTVKVIQEGEKGYTKKRVDTITVDGKVVDQRETVVETKEAKDKVIVKGTKKVEPVTPTNPTTDGHVINFSKYNRPDRLPSTPTWEYVNSLPNSEKENVDTTLKGPTSFETTEAYLKDRAENIRIARELFNYRAFNESFLKLVNADRIAKGIAPLQLDENLIKAAQIRANEQADIAQSLRSNNIAHTRPYDGVRAAYNSVIDEVGTKEWQDSTITWGENMLEDTTHTDSASGMLNYDSIANRMFGIWKASKGHYANMMDSSFTHMGVSVAQTLFTKSEFAKKTGYKGATIIGAQVFTAFDNGDLDEE